MRSERDKWRVPESDPAGSVPDPARGTGSFIVPGPGQAAEPVHSAERAPLIYCGQCGALNPATNHYCAACGATIVDAFRATEGLRIYERPDTASRVIEIVPTGTELGLVDDPDAPADFLRVKLESGRLGYARIADIEALAGADARPARPLGEPDINTNARGCVTQSGALLALLLLFMLTALALVYINQSDIEEQGIVALAACVTLGPLLLLTIALFIYARSRDEAAEAEAAEARSREGAEM